MKTLVFVGAWVLVLVGGFYLFNDYIYKGKQGDLGPISTYLCPDGRSFLASFGDNEAKIFLGDERIVALQKMAKEDRFINEEDKISLSVKDFEATISEGEEDTFSKCVYSPYISQVEKDQETIANYDNQNIGIKFSYRERPSGYYLQKPRPTSIPHPSFLAHYIMTLKKDHDELLKSTEAREGPPVISLTIFKNEEKLQPSLWVEKFSNLSNISLKIGEVEEYIIGGANAVRYKIDGLYPTDMVVAASGRNIYVFSGSYLEENSTIRKDFQGFLDSFEFIPISSLEDNLPTDKTSEVALKGKYECLPPKDPSLPHTLECRDGLLTDSGLHYALDLSAVTILAGSLSVGSEIVIDGEFTPIEMISALEWQSYSIKGIIKVESLTQN